MRIDWFDDWVDWRNEAECGEEVFSAECRLVQFAREVESALDKLLEEHGVYEYKEKWGRYDFPVESHARLKSILGKE